MSEDITELKISMGILKAQMETVSNLCLKLETIMEKVTNNHERYAQRIYHDMENRRKEKDVELNDMDTRIDDIITKVQITETKLLNELKDLRLEILIKMNENCAKQNKEIENLNNWKWLVMGGIISLTWIISNINFSAIKKFFI